MVLPVVLQKPAHLPRKTLLLAVVNNIPALQPRTTFLSPVVTCDNDEYPIPTLKHAPLEIPAAPEPTNSPA